MSPFVEKQKNRSLSSRLLNNRGFPRACPKKPTNRFFFMDGYLIQASQKPPEPDLRGHTFE